MDCNYRFLASASVEAPEPEPGPIFDEIEPPVELLPTPAETTKVRLYM